MKTIKIICNNCGKECDKPTKEINRQIKRGRTKFYCSLSCSTKDLKFITKTVKSNCLFCGKEFETTTHKKHRKCCSKECSAKYVQSFVDYNIHKKSVQKERHFPKQKEFKCVICNNNFIKLIHYSTDIKKVCSKLCHSKLISKNNRENPNCGGKLGYRRFEYNGFTMDSRWEVNLAKWMDENKIIWDRSKKKYMFFWVDKDGNRRKYFPDFYLPSMNLYLDPKNDYYLQRDLSKLKYVIEKYKIKLFYGGLEEIKQKILTCYNNH